MKFAFLLLSQMMAVSAFASNYTTLLCNYAQPRPGGTSYMLILENAPPGSQATAIVLAKARGVSRPEWKLISGAASMVQAADGGPTLIQTPRAVVDWTTSSVRELCYLESDYFSFKLILKTNSVSGLVTHYSLPVQNPNRDDCPMVSPPNTNHSTLEIVCAVQ